MLISLARLLQHKMYSGELVARYGGEEFVVLCPETSLDAAFNKAERLRQAIEKATVVKSDEFKVTASFGVSQLEADDVLQRADKALYVSKHQGRNRTSRLTSTQLRENDPEMVRPSLATPDKFVCNVTLKACIAADMIVYKLKAFVDGNGAQLGKVSATTVNLRLGSRGFLSCWGKTPDKQPVDIRLKSETTAPRLNAERIGWLKSRFTSHRSAVSGRSTSFRPAAGVCKDLREYLAADYDDMSEA